jgi:hypothetical protein
MFALRFSMSMQVGLVLIHASISAAPLAMTPVERYLETATAAERADSRLFELSRLLAPVCKLPTMWRLGMQPFPVAREAPTMERALQLRERLIRELHAQPGEVVFTSQQFKTPYAIAGVQRGDRLIAADGESVPGTTAAAVRLAGREAESRALAAMPQRHFTVRRGDVEFPIDVVAVETCEMYLRAIDSRYAYADNYGGAVAITLPMIAGISDAELTMVLAHEAAHKVLGQDNQNAGKLFLEAVNPFALKGLMDSFYKNIETDTRSPSSQDLIDADRLALTLLKAYGIGPDAYLRFLERMNDMERTGQEPIYRVTRPLSNARRADLEEQIRRVASGATVRPPEAVDTVKVAALDDVAATLLRADALTLAVVAEPVPVPVPLATSAGRRDAAPVPKKKVHRWHVPASTNFARIDDLDAVPVREEGKERFRHYLTLPSPKAFAVTAKGGWWMASNNAEAMAVALEKCTRGGASCWLYAVDDQVVYDADTAKRIAATSQLTGD